MRTRPAGRRLAWLSGLAGLTRATLWARRYDAIRKMKGKGAEVLVVSEDPDSLGVVGVVGVVTNAAISSNLSDKSQLYSRDRTLRKDKGLKSPLASPRASSAPTAAAEVRRATQTAACARARTELASACAGPVGGGATVSEAAAMRNLFVPPQTFFFVGLVCFLWLLSFSGHGHSSCPNRRRCSTRSPG